MFFRQILHGDLGCASYVIADGGEAIVVDPKWEIDEYLALAREHGFAITHILETHNHADHLSGRGRLAEATGATIHVSNKAGVEYEHQSLADGDAVEVGGVRITALATPGHRPEHTAYVVEDRTRAPVTELVLTGDSLFVGDLARPDLAVEPEEGARDLFRSLHRLLAFEDFVEVWPGHIGGSLCGGAGMSEKPGSTLGYERRSNARLKIEDESEFVQALTQHLAPQPPNFGRIVALNRGPLITTATPVPPLTPERVAAAIGSGAILLDGRLPREYDRVHVPGSINVTMVKAAVGTRAAWIVSPQDTLIVTAGTDPDALRMTGMIQAVGLLNVGGYLAGGMAAWEAASLPVECTAIIEIDELAERLKDGSVTLLDVRDDAEWQAGHVEGAVHVPYHELRDRLPDGAWPADKPIAVACAVGNRSSIAASALRRRGTPNVLHVAEGGVADLSEYGISLVTGA